MSAGSLRGVGFAACAAVLLSAGACSRQAAVVEPLQAVEPIQVDPALKPATRDPGAEVSFAAFGDTDHRDAEGQRRVARALAAVCAAAGCDFVLLLGDNFYPDGVTSVSDPLFRTAFEEPYAEVKAPFYAVLGNHDYAPWAGRLRADRVLHQVEYSKRSERWRMPGTRWREVRGPVELFGLDTTVELYGVGGDQAREVEEWLRRSGAPWKIALGHHPYLSNGSHGNAGAEGGAAGERLKAFLEKVVCGRVDLYLSGHDHTRQWLLPTCRGTELIVSGASANSYALPGSNPVRFQSDQLGFFYARASEQELTGFFVNTRGQVELTRTLTK